MSPVLPLILLCFTVAAVASEPVPMKVVIVHDGDTLTALDAVNVQHKIRLHGIDAPEIGQPFGTKSRDRLAGRIGLHLHQKE